MNRKSDKAIWVYKWNRLRSVPFKFQRACSCKLGNGAPGCHTTVYLATSWPVSVLPCGKLPTLSITDEARSLILAHINGSLTATLIHNRPLDSYVEAEQVLNSPSRYSPSHHGNTHHQSIVSYYDTAKIPTTTSSSSSRQTLYPTDAKIREKERKQKLKEKGIERVVPKKKKCIEDHHDDCGNDMSSLHDREHYGTADANLANPCDDDT